MKTNSIAIYIAKLLIGVALSTLAWMALPAGGGAMVNPLGQTK